MLRKLRSLLRKRSGEKLTPKRVKEDRERELQRLTARQEFENFWGYTGDEQQPIDPIALLENNQ